MWAWRVPEPSPLPPPRLTCGGRCPALGLNKSLWTSERRRPLGCRRPWDIHGPPFPELAATQPMTAEHKSPDHGRAGRAPRSQRPSRAPPAKARGRGLSCRARPVASAAPRRRSSQPLLGAARQANGLQVLTFCCNTLVIFLKDEMSCLLSRAAVAVAPGHARSSRHGRGVQGRDWPVLGIWAGVPMCGWCLWLWGGQVVFL